MEAAPKQKKRCKYGFKCRNAKCSFAHPKCRYGALCKNPQCKFVHPATTSVGTTAASSSSSVPQPVTNHSFTTRLPNGPPEIEIPLAADLENALDDRRLLSPIRRAQEIAARMRQEEQELEDLLRENEHQRLHDVEQLEAAQGGGGVVPQDQPNKDIKSPPPKQIQVEKSSPQSAPSPLTDTESQPPYDAPLAKLKAMGFDDDDKVLVEALESTDGDLNRSIEVLILNKKPNDKVQQMRDMGFSDEAAAAEALEQASGDLERAVEILLTQATAVKEQKPPVVVVEEKTIDDEERARYKAARNAAKKERRLLEKLGSTNDPQIKSTSLPDKDNDEEIIELPEDAALAVQRLLEEERKQREERQRQLEEEQQREKASKKAAKKERQRLKKEALSIVGAGTQQVENTVDDASEEIDLDEEAKKRRWREELKMQKERATEKKEQKMNRKREQFLKDLERQMEEREKFWHDSIAEETKTVVLLIELCAAEFCRLYPSYDRRLVVQDPEASVKLLHVCQQAYRFLYKDLIPTRVVVMGMKQQHLNDRTGFIEHWDQDKGKFSVKLDTKKAAKSLSMYILAGNLQAVPHNSAKQKLKNEMNDPVFSVRISSLLTYKDLVTDIFKSEVDCMKKASSVGKFLSSLMRERNEEERLSKEQEEEERRHYEEDRQRRAHQRQREQEEWEARQREFERRKEEYKQWKREEEEPARQEEEQARRNHNTGPCRCPECMFQRMFSGGNRGGFGMGGGRGGFPGPGFGFFFNGGAFYFDAGGDEYEDDEYDDEDEWDRQWNRMHEQEELEKDREAADLLGVSIDASAEEIKRVFRKKALKYHPDKYRADGHEMTKDEAEDHFKELSGAHDHMLAKFE